MEGSGLDGPLLVVWATGAWLMPLDVKEPGLLVSKMHIATYE